MGVFATFVSSLVRCLLGSLAHIVIGLLVISLLSFRSSLYILDNSLLSDVSFVNIFLQSVAFSNSLDFSCRAVFNFNEVLLINYFFHSLVLYLRSHCHTQGHIDFVLYLLWVLYLCILHLGLWPILNEFLWMM